MGQIRPKYVFIENVMGMVSADEGWFLEEQMYHFRRLRYRPAQDKPVLLRSSDFGVAQSRERVFMVLIRKDIDFKYEFPEPTHGPGKRPPRVLQDVIWGMEEWPKGEYCEAPFHGHYLTRNRKRRWDEFSYTIVAHADHVPLHPMGKPMKKVGTDAWVLQGKKNRRLSWRECALIQGLPKKINPSGTLVQKYRVIGNAVPPAYGKALIKPVVAFESGTS
jgi:DNA (cytosine-5)-methyltransferase 1